MDKPPSHRWLWTGVAMFGCGAVMFVAAVVTSIAHEPWVVSGTFFVLMPLCGVVGFILIGIAATKAKKEIRQLAAQAIAETHAAARARRGQATRSGD